MSDPRVIFQPVYGCPANFDDIDYGRGLDEPITHKEPDVKEPVAVIMGEVPNPAMVEIGRITAEDILTLNLKLVRPEHLEALNSGLAKYGLCITNLKE
jgi:hypothetical protein